MVDRKFLKLHKIYDICWLSCYRAVNAIVQAYHPLLTYFENLSHTDVTVKGLAKQMRRYQWYVTVHFLQDVLSVLTQLNKTFQIQGYHPYTALKKVDETCKAFTSRNLVVSEPIRWGPFDSKSLKDVGNGTFTVNLGNQGGVSVKKQIEKDDVAFVKHIVENLRSRFPDVELFKAAAIFDPDNLPLSDQEFHTYCLNLPSIWFSLSLLGICAGGFGSLARSELAQVYKKGFLQQKNFNSCSTKLVNNNE